MSQVTQITIDNVAFGTFRSNLNDTLNALNSMHSGTSRPASATTGTIWLDTTNAGSNSLTIKFFDGTDDITVADIDTSANTINFIDSTVTTELLSDLSPQLGGMLDVNGNAIGNGTEELIKFSETASAVNEITVTNSATGNAPEISATGDDTDIDLKLTPKGSGNLNLDGLIFPNADGTTGQFLKTDGSGNLSFDNAGGITEADMWRVTANFTNAGNGVDEDTTSNWERADTADFEKIGTGLTESSGIFSFPSTGKYLINAQVSYYPAGANSGISLKINITTDNSSYSTRGHALSGAAGADRPESISTSYIVDVTNTSNVKFKIVTNGATNVTWQGDSNKQYFCFTCIRLGDT